MHFLCHLFFITVGEILRLVKSVHSIHVCRIIYALWTDLH